MDVRLDILKSGHMSVSFPRTRCEHNSFKNPKQLRIINFNCTSSSHQRGVFLSERQRYSLALIVYSECSGLASSKIAKLQLEAISIQHSVVGSQFSCYIQDGLSWPPKCRMKSCNSDMEVSTNSDGLHVQYLYLTNV